MVKIRRGIPNEYVRVVSRLDLIFQEGAPITHYFAEEHAARVQEVHERMKEKESPAYLANPRSKNIAVDEVIEFVEHYSAAVRFH